MTALMKTTFLKIPVLSALTLLLLLPFSACQETVIEQEIYFFYMEHCPGCESYIMAEELSATVSLLAEKNKTVTGETLNLIRDDDALRMKTILEEKNLAEISYVIPLLVVNDSYVAGYEEISEKVTELTSLYKTK